MKETAKTNTAADKQDLANSKLAVLQDILKKLDRVLIAYSGGVDSTFLLKVASDVLGERVTAVTAHSEVQPDGELDQCTEFVKILPVTHIIIETNELSNPDFTSNPINRCYHCKKGLFTRLTELAAKHGIKYILDGSNYDDTADYRPGRRAIRELSIQSPLLEAEMTKEDIRFLSKRMNLPTWDQPASPCLASRVPYNQTITIEKLSRIDQAEKFIRSYGIKELRVRDHEDMARIEVPKDQMNIILDKQNSIEINEKLKSLGYIYVTLDLKGFRSGSLNEGLKRETNGQGQTAPTAGKNKKRQDRN